jgi:hypothetical protein
MHWNGTAWERSFIPEPNNSIRLNDVSGVAANDVWAVGSYYSESIRGDQALILHWDGTSWSPAQLPDFQPQSTRVNGVFARAADDVWAVGMTGPNPLFLHWNGTAWIIEPNAIAPVNTNLTSVTAVSKTRAWAVGGSSEGAIVMYWDGDDWRQVSIPDTQTFPSSLYNVTAVSENDVWAVGAEIQIVRHADVRKLLVLHWDGTQWLRMPANVSGSASTGQGVTSTKEGSLWVAGSYFNPGKNLREPLLLRLHKTTCPPPAATPVPPTPAMPLEPPALIPGSGSVTFPETGKTIRGVFLDYWQRNGNLAQQGYPISNVMGEISDLDGRIYTVQYFERAVFEYHPENQPPYNVLLSQLGTFQYKQKYPDGAHNQRANPDAGTRFFPETGKHLGGAFHYYWVNHGGLVQQGYPITEEFTQVSPLDGKLYTVQYFERAVFEYHPENQPPFEVLLSQLGRFRYDGRYGTPTPVTSTPLPKSKLLAKDVSSSVVATDHYLLWIETARAGNPIFGYDVRNGNTFVLTNRSSSKFALATDGKKIVWLERGSDSAVRAYGYDLDSRNEVSFVGTLSQTQNNYYYDIALAGDVLYYSGIINQQRGVVARNLTTGVEEILVADGRRPVAADGALLWSKEVASCNPPSTHPPCIFDGILYMRKSGDTKDILVHRSPGQDSFRGPQGYDLSHGRVVWSGTSEGVRLYDANTSTLNIIFNRHASYPLIRGNLVAWVGEEKRTKLILYDTNTGQFTTPVSVMDARIETEAIVGQEAIAYRLGGPAQWREDLAQGDLYILELGRN